MAQKLSIDPDIVDSEILKNSLKKIDQGFQNLIEIKKMAVTRYSSLGKKPDATIEEIVQAFGFTNWNSAASWNFKGLEPSSLILLKDPIIL